MSLTTRPMQLPPGTAFDRRLGEILEQAARLFSEKGYEGASVRDLSRVTGISLAGLYHYFDSKRSLLYALQKHTFESVLTRAQQRIAEEGLSAEERLRRFVGNHLEFFLSKRHAMKVLSHEDEALRRASGERRELKARNAGHVHVEENDVGLGLDATITSLKHAYYKLCLGLVTDLGRRSKLRVHPRVAVMSLFGMLNWTYTWHVEGRDPGATELARQMSDLFISGIRSGEAEYAMPAAAGNGRRKPHALEYASEKKRASGRP